MGSLARASGLVVLTSCLGLVGSVLTDCGNNPTTADGGADATSDVGSDVGSSSDAAADVRSDASGDSGACSGGSQVCSGRCVDTQHDSNHCGTCSTVCTGTQACVTGSCQTATFNDVGVASHWLSYQLTNVDSNVKSFSGGTFDGRYVYFAPNGSGSSGLIARYDTQSNAFTTMGSWKTFDATKVKSTAVGFNGAVFDGRYVYFIPWTNNTVLRYDTTAPFDSISSYEPFETTNVDPSAKGFVGAAFDGKYIYLSPWYANADYSSVALQFDTSASFSDVGSWKEYDLTNIDVTAMGYYGCVFDAKYVDFVPLRTTNNVSNGLVVRYDTTSGDFTIGGHWTSYNAKNASSAAAGFAGGAFDGTNVYFVPLNGFAARYDTTRAFTDAGSWSALDTSKVNPSAVGFEFGGFDGKYIYYGANAHSLVTRFDSTSATLDAGSAWGTFDISTLNPAASAVSALVFDGEYMYFAPANGSTVAVRFDAKSPAGMPAVMASRGGSFY